MQKFLTSKHPYFLGCWLGLTGSIQADTIALPTIQVTPPSNSNEILDSLPETHPGYSIILKRQDFINQKQTIAEILQTQTGIQIQQSAGLGSYAAINIRGSSAHQIMVYLDGIPLNSANGGGVNLNNIPLETIEKIEIYLNQAPIQFVTQYQGGVVNLITRRHQSKAYNEIKLMKGSYGAQKISLFHQNQTQLNRKTLSWLLQGNYQSAENHYPILNDNQTNFNPYDDRIEPRYNAQTEQKSFLGKLRYSLSNTETLSTQLLYNLNLNHLPNQQNTQNNNAYLQTTQNSLKLSYQNHALADSPWIAQTNINLLQTHLHFYDNLSQIGLGKQNNRYQTDSLQAQQYLENSYQLSPNWLLTWQNTFFWKQDTYRTHFKLDNTFLNNTTSKRQRQTLQYSLSLPLEHTSGWLFTPSLTIQKFDDTPSQPQDTDAPIHEWNTTWQLGTLYPLNAHHQLKARISTGIRQPSFFEKYSDRGLIVGNPELKKETSLQKEIGYRYQQTPKTFIQKALFEIQLYQNQTQHIIVQSYDARGIGRSDNLSQATIQGIETHLNLQLSTHTELDLNSRYQSTHTQSNYSAYHNKQLPNLPTTTATATLKQQIYAWHLYYQFHYESPVYLERSNLLTTPAKQLHDLSLSYIQKQWQLNLQIHNFTDQKVEYFNGYPTPGKTIYLTLTLKL